jgi:DNA-binding IclR family transcriptional regulator
VEKHGRAVQESLRHHAKVGACFSKGDWQQDIHAVAVPMRLEVDSETLVFTCGVPAVLSGHGALEDEAPALQRMVRSVESAYLARRENAAQ